MKIIKIFILIFFLLNNCRYILAQTFEKDWQWLKFTETTAGDASSVYENALFDLVANNLRDTLMVPYYDSISTRLTAIIPQIEKNYGIESIQYWNLIDDCSTILTLSSQGNVNIKKHRQLVNFLKSLEKNYHQSGKNEYIFVAGLSDVYSYIGDYNKAFYWWQKRYDLAKKSNNVDESVGAYYALADLYAKRQDHTGFAIFVNDLIGDATISSQEKRVIIDYILNTNYEALSDTNKTDITTCILEFEDIRFSDLQTLCHQATKHHDYYIFDTIENSKSFHKFNIEEKFNYYKWNSKGFSFYKNPKRSVDYLLKATHLALANNRDDLNWHYHGSESTIKTHNWYWVAYYYENELFDKTNALLFYDRNIEATKNYYGEKSAVYYTELITQANRYDLWRNDIVRAAYYDSLAVQVSRNVFGIDSEKYANSLSLYIYCLRRQNHYRKALSLCNDYFSAADSSNVYSHKIYNQAAMCYESLGMNEAAIISFIKAIDKTNDRNTKSSYAVNLSSLLVDDNNVKVALDFVDKYEPETDNPIDQYTFLNTKANILANIDRNKAYKTFCEAEQYETSKNVQLLVDRQIYHYLDKAKVAPDLHLKFSSLQQALKIFDKNDTADSLMFARIIADMADYYHSVMNTEKAIQLYKHACEVYLRNSKEITIDHLDFFDKAIMFGLSQGYDSQIIFAAEQSLAMRKQMQGEMSGFYILRKFQLLDTYSRFGLDSKADSLAKEIISAKLPSEWENERDYYLGLYEQQSRKDLKKAAVYYEKYLSSSDCSIAGTRIYGDLLNIYKELGEYDKFDAIEGVYVSKWYQDIESKWYHMTDNERQNYLKLLKGWQISLAKYACTPKSIENAANASLFGKGRLTQTTKAINEELSRLGKTNLHHEISISQNQGDIAEVEDAIDISEHITSMHDSINRAVIYNNLSTKRLKNIVNSNIANIRKVLFKDDICIDFINIDRTTIYAYIINKNSPVELKKLSLTADLRNLTEKSFDDIALFIRSAKRLFFSPSETLSVCPLESFLRTRFPNLEIHRVLSLSDIHKENRINIKDVVAIGNPRFNDELTTKQSQNRSAVWQPLPATKIEIDSISYLLKKKNINIYLHRKQSYGVSR